MNVDLSIVIPAFQAEKTIGKCIESALTEHMQVEIIIVNDGSTDETSNVCHEYARKHSMIRVLDTSHAGHGTARSLGVKNAKGKYILFLDADDYLSCGAVSELAGIAEKSEDELVIFSFFFWDDVKEEYADYEDLKRIKDRYTLFQYGTSYLWNKLIRRDVLEDIEFENVYGEDDIVMLPLLLSVAEYAIYDKALYYHTSLGGSLSSDSNRVVSVVESFQKSVQKMKEKGLYEKNRQAVLRMFFERRNVFLDMLKYRFSDEQLKQIDLRFQKFYRDELPELANVMEWNICFSGMPTEILPWVFPYHCRLCELNIERLCQLMTEQGVENAFAVVGMERELLKYRFGLVEEAECVKEIANRFERLFEILRQRNGKGVLLFAYEGRTDLKEIRDQAIREILRKHPSVNVIYAEEYENFVDGFIGEVVSAGENSITRYSFQSFRSEYWDGFTNWFWSKKDAKSNLTAALKREKLGKIILYGVTELSSQIAELIEATENCEVVAVYDVSPKDKVVSGHRVRTPDFTDIRYDAIVVMPFYIYDSIFFSLVDRGVRAEKIYSIEYLLHSL